MIHKKRNAQPAPRRCAPLSTKSTLIIGVITFLEQMQQAVCQGTYGLGNLTDPGNAHNPFAPLSSTPGPTAGPTNDPTHPPTTPPTHGPTHSPTSPPSILRTAGPTMQKIIGQVKRNRLEEVMPLLIFIAVLIPVAALGTYYRQTIVKKIGEAITCLNNLLKSENRHQPPGRDRYENELFVGEAEHSPPTTNEYAGAGDNDGGYLEVEKKED